MRNNKPFKEKIICFDFDGTCTLRDIYPDVFLDNVNLEIKKVVNWCSDHGYRVVINSARDTIYYDDVKMFLDHNGFKYDYIHLKCKPTADLYIDDKSLFQTARHLQAFIESYFCSDLCEYIHKLVSNRLFSEMATNIANVPENPTYAEPDVLNYKIALPITGGMDSTTLWKMASLAGENFIPYYVDLGQKYAKMELEVVEKIIGEKPNVISLEVQFTEFAHILLGRNLAIIMLLAEEFKRNNWWGEIWFGNLVGESPIMDGDKSKRFFNDVNALLVHHGYDVRVVNPLMCLDKFDLVSYWNELGEIETLTQTKSCFSDKYFQCGECQSCFRKWLAFKYHNIDISNQFPLMKFDIYVEKYKNKMQSALDENNFAKYSKNRILKTLKVLNEL